MTDSEKEIALKKIVTYLIKKSEIKRGTLTQKINQTVQFLNQMNYRVRWEAHINAPLIIITHCPYKSMVKDFPVLCKMDAILLEQLLGQTVSQDIQVTEINQPEVQCMFRV